VYRTGSFAEVAHEQNQAPSSISRAINALESLLQTRLFQRTTRSLTPTQAGESYYAKIVPLIEEIDLTHENLRNARQKPSGRLRVTASASYGQIMIAPTLGSFCAEYPEIELDLILSDRRADLINDQIDVAIRHGHLADSNLIARKLMSARYHLVASPAYLERYGTPKHPEELGTHKLVTFSYDNFRTDWSFSHNHEQHSIKITPTLTATNAVAIRQCARDGVGMALLADWTIREDLQSGKLVPVLNQWHASGSSNDTSIWLLYPSNRFIPAKTKAFTQFLVNTLNNQ